MLCGALSLSVCIIFHILTHPRLYKSLEDQPVGGFQSKLRIVENPLREIIYYHQYGLHSQYEISALA